MEGDLKPKNPKLWQLGIAMLWLWSSAYAQAQSPSIQEIINAVNLDSLTNTVKVLSGEVGSKNRGTSDTIRSRDYSQNGHGFAVDYLKGKLESSGLPVQLQPFTTILGVSGTNLLVEQKGTSMPGRKYILCAHYDSASDDSTVLAPGADDNASGCAAVLEAARLLSRYKTSYTVVYALWDLEEFGGFGSRIYADSAAARGDTIMGVLNLDMLGWDSNGDSLMNIHASEKAQSVELADTVAFVSRLYSFRLKPTVYNPGTSQSDHAAFWRRGYSAVLLIEAFWGGDFNPHAHHSDDLLEYFNLSYFHQLAKLAAGSIAFLADVQGPLEVAPSQPLVQAFRLEQNYPNPFNPKTTIRYGLPVRSSIRLSVYNVLGQEVALLEDRIQEAGEYQMEFDGIRLASGVYFYRLQAESNTITRTMVFLK